MIRLVIRSYSEFDLEKFKNLHPYRSGGHAGRTCTSFAPLEYADLSSTPEVLERMAKLSGGTVVVPEDAEKELAEYFGAGRSEVTEQVESDIWDNPIAFIVLALAMAAVWIWRRRKGLA